MWNSTVNIMLYVDNVANEKKFWRDIGFEILNEEIVMGYSKFDMRVNFASNTIFTVFDKTFIQQISPEVADNVASVLFETSDINLLHAHISQFTNDISEINEQPFLNFNFRSPSGIYFAVKGVAHES